MNICANKLICIELKCEVTKRVTRKQMKIKSRKSNPVKNVNVQEKINEHTKPGHSKQRVQTRKALQLSNV